MIAAESLPVVPEAPPHDPAADVCADRDLDAECWLVAHLLAVPGDLSWVYPILWPADLSGWTGGAYTRLLAGVRPDDIRARLTRFQRGALVCVGGREVAVSLARHLHDLGERRRAAELLEARRVVTERAVLETVRARRALAPELLAQYAAAHPEADDAA